MYTFLVDMPPQIKGFSMLDDEGNHIIILNSRLNYEANLKAYLHERGHEKDLGHFNNIDELEKLRHGKGRN